MPTCSATGGRRARPRAVVAAAVLVATTLLASACVPAGKRPTRPVPDGGQIPSIIIDTDFSHWWDDATAIGLANVLQQQGKVRILGIVSDIPNTVSVAAIDAVNTAYGHPHIPLGAVAGSDADTSRHGYSPELTARLPHSVGSSDDVPEAVALYRRLLARAPDGSVTIVALGAYTNLAGLLRSSAGDGSPLDGRALVAKKVQRLVVMDGVLPGGGPPFTNQRLDLEAAAHVVGGVPGNPGWPTQIAWADGRVGISTRVGGRLCDEAERDHPMRIVYEFLFDCGPPGDGNWDAPTLLYAVGESPHLFSEHGHGGAVVINEQGGLGWDESSPRPDDFYIRLEDQAALNELIDELLPLGVPAPCVRRACRAGTP